MRRYVQDYGFDKKNMIQMITYTVPEGETEIGGVLKSSETITY